jgi:hypothetical protein
MVHDTHGAAAQLPDDFIAPDAIHPILVIAHARVVLMDENDFRQENHVCAGTAR